MVADSEKPLELQLLELAERLRDKNGLLSEDSILCVSCANLLIELQDRVQVTAMDRIAVAIEQAAMHGWGNVPGDKLLPD